MKRILLCLAMSVLTVPAHAALTSSAKQIAAARISQTVYEYTYQVSVKNTGPTVTNVKAFVSSTLPNVTVLDDMSVIGDLATGLRVTSPDTVKVRVDRSKPFRTTDLRWTVGFEAKLVLQGKVRSAAGPMAGAQVFVRADRSGSPRAAAEYGRPVVEIVGTVADAVGNYSVEVPVVTDGEFVSMKSVGAGDASHVVFASLLRSAESLLDIVQRTGLPPVAPGTYPLAATALPALNLSSLSTGVAVVLWNSVAGSYVDSDAKLLDAERSGNAIMMLERAAAIELARERGASSLPAGIPDTLELVDNAEAYRSFLAPIEIATPGATLAAAAQVVNALSVPYTRSSARGDWLLLDVNGEFPLSGLRSDTRLNLLSGNAFEGTASNGGKGTGTWTVDAAGRVVADYSPALQLGLAYASKAPCDGSPYSQIPVQTTLERNTVTRLWDGVVTDQLVNVVRYRTSYPGNPCYADEVSESLSLWGTFTALRTRDALSFTASQLAGHTIGLVVQHPLFASVASSGYNIPEMRYVRLPLLANGTGSVPVRTASGVQNLSYLWSVTTDKDLLISFADGTTNRILLVGATGPFLATASIAEYPAGSRINAAVTGTPLAYSDVAPQFVTADIADFRFRSRINYRENLPSQSPNGDGVFDFAFRGDGRGCTFFSDAATGGIVLEARPVVWQIDAAGQLDYTRDNPNPNGIDQRRLWRLIAMEDRGGSTWYWMDEQLQSYRPGVGELPPEFSDSPGRLTAYEIVGDASACVLP
jgi:hypothetical protein